MPQRAFADLLNETAAELYPEPQDRPVYDSSVVARLENGTRRTITIQDVTIYAAVDPKCRGLLWIVQGEERGDATHHETDAETAARVGAEVGTLESAESLFAEGDERDRGAANE